MAARRKSTRQRNGCSLAVKSLRAIHHCQRDLSTRSPRGHRVLHAGWFPLMSRACCKKRREVEPDCATAGDEIEDENDWREELFEHRNSPQKLLMVCDGHEFLVFDELYAGGLPNGCRRPEVSSDGRIFSRQLHSRLLRGKCPVFDRSAAPPIPSPEPAPPLWVPSPSQLH